MATHAEILRRAKSLASEVEQRGRRVALLCSYNLDFIKPYLIVSASDLGAPIAPWIAPFGQFEQMIRADDSALWKSRPEALVLLLRAADLDAELAEGIEGVPPARRRARNDELLQRVLGLAREARRRFSGPILVANFVHDRPLLDLFDGSRPDGITHLIASLNLRMAEALAAESDMHVFDYAGVANRFGTDRFVDRRLWALGRIAVAPEAQEPLASSLARSIAGVTQAASKCLVLDLDNTLWGGVLGDDGMAALKLGDEHPGSAFKAFQRALRGYRERGMLLAIASKNDEATVREALDTHPDMILRSADFAAIEANWQAKSASLVRIAKKLNIGLDSLVFFDDNPVERAEVRAHCPGVRVVEMPVDVLHYVAALATVPLLDRPRVLEEDRARATMVADDAQRERLAATTQSIEEFLAGLEMVATVGQSDDTTIERISQLIHKTNQFNLTTRRHSLEDVRKLASASDARVLWMRLADRFGDMGLIAVGIVRVEGDVGRVDTLLMSCRVMGRGVEDAVLAHLVEAARELGAKSLLGEYRRTAKNDIVREYYRERGFAELSQEGESALYSLADLSAAERWPRHIARRDAASAKE